MSGFRLSWQSSFSSCCQTLSAQTAANRLIWLPEDFSATLAQTAFPSIDYLVRPREKLLPLLTNALGFLLSSSSIPISLSCSLASLVLSSTRR